MGVATQFWVVDPAEIRGLELVRLDKVSVQISLNFKNLSIAFFNLCVQLFQIVVPSHYHLLKPKKVILQCH